MGVVRRHEPRRLLRVSGHDRRVARIRERVPDVPERLRVVVHREDALPLPGLSVRRRAAGEPGEAGRGLPGPPES